MKKISMKTMFMVMVMVAVAAVFFASCESLTAEGTAAEIAATNKVREVVRDSIVHHYDTLPGGEIIVRDTQWLHDSTRYTYILAQVHWMWSINGGYLVGDDSVYLEKFEEGVPCGSWQNTARHKGTVTLNVGTSPYPTTVVGDTLWLSVQGNGVFSGTIFGHYVTLTLGNQAMEPTPVIMDNRDWRDYLHPHEDAVGQYVVFGQDGVARGRVIGLDGSNAGTVTAPYTINDPEDTTRRLLYYDTNYYHVSSNSTGEWTGNIVKFKCANKRTITAYYNLAPTAVASDSNFYIYFPYLWASTGSATPAMDGQTVSFSSGTASWGGLTVTLTAQPRQCSINPIPLPCNHSIVNGTLHWNNGNPYVTIYGNLEGTSTTTTHAVPATNRHETGRDTAWNGCGHLVTSSLTSVLIQHTLARTGVVTVNYNIAPLTETFTVSESTMYYTQYMVSGDANPSAIGTTANVSGNTVTIGGVTLVLTPGPQNWCNLIYTTATLTSSGIVLSFTYNGGSGSVTIPVTFNNPDPLFTETVLIAVATDGYKASTPNLAAGHRVTNLIVVVEKHIGSTTQYWHYHGNWATVTTRADLDSVQITATEASYYVAQVALGFYPAIVYNHNNPVQFSRGVVKSTYVTNYWQLIYNIVYPNVAWAYTLSNSAWTLVGDGGRDALRGVMNSSGSITADGITKQIF